MSHPRQKRNVLTVRFTQTVPHGVLLNVPIWLWVLSVWWRSARPVAIVPMAPWNKTPNACRRVSVIARMKTGRFMHRGRHYSKTVGRGKSLHSLFLKIVTGWLFFNKSRCNLVYVNSLEKQYIVYPNVSILREFTGEHILEWGLYPCNTSPQVRS